MINLHSGGIIVKRIIRKQKEVKNICSHLFLNFFSNGHDGFLEDYSIIGKTDKAYPARSEEYWRRVLKTHSLWVEHDRLIVSFE